MLLHGSIEGPHCWDHCWLAAVPADYGRARVYSRRPRIELSVYGVGTLVGSLTTRPAGKKMSVRRSFPTCFHSDRRPFLSFAPVCNSLSRLSLPPASILAQCGHPLAALSPPRVYSCVCSAAHPALSADDGQWRWWWWGGGRKRDNPRTLNAIPLLFRVHGRGFQSN